MTDDASPPQGQTAYRQLLDEIRRGALPPGARLRETDLADRLGISRTPVREAIRQLEADGLVTHLPRQGATVRQLDYAEVIELYEMRAVLEGTAARLAARAASDVELAELAEINATLADAERATVAVAEHAAILAALAARDGAAAELATRAHVSSAMAARLRAMRGRPLALEEET
ncbi:MAG: GntR family transcriptional regulator [Rhodobacterales bacterium]|nr:GntR family transcriptional regulator [Rhodobacterales bacterium]